MMQRAALLLALLSVFSSFSSSHAQITPPEPGVEIPPSVRDWMQQRGGSELEHAWVQKARIAREKRERFIEERGFYSRDMMTASQSEAFSVTGTLRIPVFCVKFSNTGADPYPVATLQTRLYSGPFAPETLTQYYSEVSYGDLNLTGTVYGWTTLPQVHGYYAGPGSCDGMCLSGKVGELITTTLIANDGAVNFGQYDNDGPDGIPNSGDDDGYADFVAFVHAEAGAECGVHGRIWSHHSVLRGWTGSPFLTNDARAGGGFILVDEYVIQPAVECDGVSTVNIGVFCHEFGHALGLPDLYDPEGDSNAVGDWCLMAHGVYNTRSQPAHLGAYCKTLLGWSDVVVVPGVATPYSIADVETHRLVYRMDNPAPKWRWTSCTLGGDKFMRCGLMESEAANRNWVSGTGYGNGWDATLSRDFYYNGVGGVEFLYSLYYELEPNYDVASVTITAGGTTTTLASYTGTATTGNEEFELMPYLTAPGPYTISFNVRSDGAYSDEDGGFPTACGAMLVEAVGVWGGGESHSTYFLEREDGWSEEPPLKEYFLVENRRPIGSDANLHGSGLVVWHVDQATQSGGVANNQPRGVEVVQADGLRDLELAVNNGDAGDPYPGTSNKLALTQVTNPSSQSHSGGWPVYMQLNSGNGNPISATMYGGFWWLEPTAVTPFAGTSGTVVQLQIDGTGFVKTPAAKLVPYVPDPEEMTTADRAALVYEFDATSVEWIGSDRITAEFDLTGAPNGLYDVVVFNPDGASSRLRGVYTISGGTTSAGDAPRTFELSPNYPNPFNPSTTINFQVPSRVHVALRVYDVKGALVRTLVDESKPAGVYAQPWDGRDDRGTPVSSGVYFFRMTAGDFSDVRKMTLLK